MDVTCCGRVYSRKPPNFPTSPMRARILAMAGAFAMGACAKGPNVAVSASPPAPATPVRQVATPVPGAANGATHVIREVGNGMTYVFEPATLTVKEGDLVRFVMVSGGPHNVAFDGTKLSDVARAAISAGMPDQVMDLSGKFLIRPGETYVVSFRNVPPGTYPFWCTPHLAMDQRGVITVVSR